MLPISRVCLHNTASAFILIPKLLLPCHILFVTEKEPENKTTVLKVGAFPVVRRELEVLQRTIQERNGEVRQLQKQLTDLERDKHTEVVKLRLEVYNLQTDIRFCKPSIHCTCIYNTRVCIYKVLLTLQYDAKLLKLQKQNSKNQYGQSSSSSINHEIFRRVRSFLPQEYP